MTIETSSPGSGGQQLDSLRRSNVVAVLNAVRSRGPLSRSEIAVAVGLSATAVTKIVAELVRVGVVDEATPALATRERGRPRRPVQISRDRHRVVGVHIGLQRVTVGLVDLSGEVISTRAKSHGSHQPGRVIARARDMVAALLDETGTTPASVLGFGACSGGWVSPDSGTVRSFPGLGWSDVPLARGLAVEGLPEPVVDSSVRGLAGAESRLAAVEGIDNALYVFVGNVVGCAHVLNGRIARGRLDAAGSIDHVSSPGRPGIECSCGRRDCLWAVASDIAVVTAARERGLLGANQRIEDLIELSNTHTQQARAAGRLLDERARRVGQTVGALLDLFDPQLVIVGGDGIGLAPERFGHLVEAAHGRTAKPHDTAPIRPAALSGPPSLVRGAATQALEAFYADPLDSAGVA